MMIFLYISVVLANVSAHDMHVSKSELNYDTASHSLQISMRLFLDDLELALHNRGAEDLKLFSKNESKGADKWISEYISDKLKFEVEGKGIKMNFIGREITEDLAGVWCYIEVVDINLNELLKIRNDIFMEIYDDQKHVMVITKDNKRIDHWIMDSESNSKVIKF